MRYLSIDTDPNTARVSRIGLGTWQFGSREWGYGQSYAGQEAHAIVRRAIELGVTLFDTAEIYGFGRSERILGQAIGEDRESVFLATKIFPLLPVAPVVEQRAVASANRLGTRQLDLYQVHQPNPLVKDGTIMRGMRALQRVGLVREVGVSNYSLERWRAAEHALGSRVLSNQVRYSLVDRSPERDLLPFAESTGHVVIAYSPLAQGLLSGKYHRGTAGEPRPGREPAVPAREPRPGRRPDRCPARGGRRAFRHARPDRPGLGHPPARRSRHTGRIKRAAAREQRRRRQHRSHRGRIPGPARGSNAVPAHHRAGDASPHVPGPLPLAHPRHHLPQSFRFTGRPS